MELEDAEMFLKEWVKDDRDIRNNKAESDYEKFCETNCIAIETVLNTLERWEKLINDLEDDVSIAMHEIDKKDKIINAMAGDLNDYDGDGLCFYYTESTKTWGSDRIPTCGLNKSSHCIECIKQYYEKKAEKV